MVMMMMTMMMMMVELMLVVLVNIRFIHYFAWTFVKNKVAEVVELEEGQSQKAPISSGIYLSCI